VVQSIDQIRTELDSASAETENLQNEESKLKEYCREQSETMISRELAEVQMKRLNTRNALDVLRAEEEKRITARRLFLNEKRVQLRTKLKSVNEQKESISTERGKIEHIQEEIQRFTALIAREEQKPEQTPQEVAPEQPLNRDRIGRLILLLFTNGPTRPIVDSLAEELDWSKKQADDFLALARGEGNRGLGNEWAEWLNKLVSDE
jgi:hypothetical protein